MNEFVLSEFVLSEVVLNEFVLSVCPRVGSVKSLGKNRIPVRIFNMTTKVVYLKPKSIICGLKEVKVMRHTDLDKTDKYARDLESKESNTGNI